VIGLDIHKAGTSDIDQLIAMREAFLREEHPDLTPDQIIAQRAVLEDYFTRHLNRDFWGYFAIVDAEIAAAVYLVAAERPAHPRLATGKLGTVLNVYTKPVYRRRGYASALLKQMLADAQQLGISLVELQATQAGKAVYDTLGFTVKQSAYTPMEYRLRP